MSLDDPARPLEDADRRAAISRLRRAAEDGRLDPHDLDERVARVNRARLVGELNQAFAGVPPEPSGAQTVWPTGQMAHPPSGPATPSSSLPGPSLPMPSLPVPAGYRPDDRLSLSAAMSDEKRRGRWVLPPYIRAHAGLSNVKLDCRQAEAAAPVIDVEVGIGMGNVVFVLPPGWAVNAERLGKGIGTIKVRVPSVAAPGCPTIVLHGQLGAGTLVAREENWVERRFRKGG
ncbi:MAG: DUF1707 domain-containing protein [Dermatophilaceae bacterium]